jgi:succinate dehydrogenase / fumarate reductase cytochrome b subunit
MALSPCQKNAQAFVLHEAMLRQLLIACYVCAHYFVGHETYSMGTTMADAKSTERPVSPHLQIYRWPLPMAMSILHRITGGALYGGTLLLAWWLIAAGSGPNAYGKFAGFVDSIFGRLILFGYTWALIHHMLGGIRHLIWDTGRGFSPQEREWLALATGVGSVILTVLLWIVSYFFIGGAR